MVSLGAREKHQARPELLRDLFSGAVAGICYVSEFCVRGILLVGQPYTHGEPGNRAGAEYRGFLLPGTGSDSKPGTRAKNFANSRERRGELAGVVLAGAAN